MLEGLILQLFGHGLSMCQVESGKRLAASGEQQRLEVVRRLLEESPENDYTLNELAQRAAMSPSSLRSKFRAAYGCSVFDYLRDCRLEHARGYLLEGYSVQQAALDVGLSARHQLFYRFSSPLRLFARRFTQTLLIHICVLRT